MNLSQYASVVSNHRWTPCGYHDNHAGESRYPRIQNDEHTRPLKTDYRSNAINVIFFYFFDIFCHQYFFHLNSVNFHKKNPSAYNYFFWYFNAMSPQNVDDHNSPRLLLLSELLSYWERWTGIRNSNFFPSFRLVAT